MALRERSKKAESVRNRAKNIEKTAKKKLGKIVASELADIHKLQYEQVQIQKELCNINESSSKKGALDRLEWNKKAMLINEHLKQVLEREIDFKYQLAKKTDETVKQLELETRPLKYEMPTITEMSEDERRQLIKEMDDAIEDIKKKQRENEWTAKKLKKRMIYFRENLVDPAAPREEVIAKLKGALDIVFMENEDEISTVKSSVGRGTTNSLNSNPQIEDHDSKAADQGKTSASEENSGSHDRQPPNISSNNNGCGIL